LLGVDGGARCSDDAARGDPGGQRPLAPGEGFATIIGQQHLEGLGEKLNYQVQSKSPEQNLDQCGQF